MIELIFTDSGAAALSDAKNVRNTPEPVGVQIVVDSEGGTRETPFVPAPYTGPKLAGSTSDIAAIWLMGDVGEIASLTDWSTRLKLLREISMSHAFETDDWIYQEAARATALVRRLRRAGKTGEPVRVWWSDTPGDTCGFYWAMHLLKDSAGPVTAVQFPRLWRRAGEYRPLRGTGELDPGDFYAALPLERPVEPGERGALAQLWTQLTRENAPLRAVVNGELRSVEEDFYDKALRGAIPEGEFPVAQAIGSSLLAGPAGVYDWWYAHRIRQFIADGELRVVKKNSRFYYWVVARA